LLKIDFPEVMQRKLALIEVRQRLNEQFEPVHTYRSLDNFGNHIDYVDMSRTIAVEFIQRSPTNNIH
jgi:hypothetical protein